MFPKTMLRIHPKQRFAVSVRPPLLFGVLCLLALAARTPLEASELDSSIDALRAVNKLGVGNEDALKALAILGNSGPGTLTQLLSGMDDANPLAVNYLRAAVETVVQRAQKSGRAIPLGKLKAFVLNVKHSDRGRRLAFEMVVDANPEIESWLLDQMLDDPALELRRDAVAGLISEAEVSEAEELEKAPASGGKALAKYRRAFQSARDLDQIDLLATKLAELGVKVDLPRHFGFITNWKVIGPFDNTAMKGFDVVNPPEQTIEFNAQYEGKLGPVGWIDYSTDEKYGLVNLNEALDKHKGATAYAVAEFYSPNEREVDVRFGCINASKLWLNGKLLASNDVYHAGQFIDQYAVQGKLMPGKNLILLKVCQNEQTDSWAQVWEFQLRICDRVGTAISSSK